MEGQPQSAGRHFVDRSKRRAMARPAGGISFACDLLAEIARLGRAGCVVDDLADVSGGVESQGLVGLERGVY